MDKKNALKILKNTLFSKRIKCNTTNEIAIKNRKKLKLKLKKTDFVLKFSDTRSGVRIFPSRW